VSTTAVSLRAADRYVEDPQVMDVAGRHLAGVPHRVRGRRSSSRERAFKIML
jgi:hypothetical protein